MENAPRAYTARQIAAARGSSVRWIQRLLSTVKPDSYVVQSGNQTRAWLFCSLPATLQEELQRIADYGGYRNTECLLVDGNRQPVEPESELRPKAGPIDRFFELRRAVQSPLSAAEQTRVLNMAIEQYDALASLGESARAIKKELMDLLCSCEPKLAPNREALRFLFSRKYKKFVAAGRKVEALKDGRRDANRKRSKQLPQEDVDIVIAHSVIGCGGRVAQGWRECIDRQWLSEATASRFLHNPASKSHVPHSVVEAVRREVDMMKANHHGPCGTRDNGAYVERYWGCVPAMAWFCFDDATLPVYYHVPDGKGWYTLMRGQFLIGIDARSTYILGYALMPERNYNARVIRSLITRICDEYGLPRTGFLLERGIWENSKILKGETGDVPIEYAEVETGLRGFGLRFHHCIRARSKPVERPIGALQSLMEGEPGYAGRNERLDNFEEFHRLKLAVERRQLDPRERFYSGEQWDNRLAEFCSRYNTEPQQGKHTGGLSPEDAMERYKARDDFPIRFDARCRYLLANHRRPILVTKNGITLKFGKQVYNYRNRETGKLRGETVIAWFDPENPEVLAVTDMDRENAFCVERSKEVPAMDAPEEILTQELQRAGDHMHYAATRYRTLRAKYDQQFRPNLLSRETIELGQQIASGRAAAADAQQEKNRLQSRAVRAYRAAGIPMPSREAPRPDQVAAAEDLAKLLNEGDDI